MNKAEIDAAMQTVVENNVFNSTGGDLVEAVEGCLRTVNRYYGKKSTQLKKNTD